MKSKLHNLFLSLVLAVTVAFVMQFTRCKKSNSDGLPVLTTGAVENITPVTATGGGTIKSEGKEPTWYRGICWSTFPEPTTADFQNYDGQSGTGDFTFSLGNLKPSTQYFVRAFAKNSAGTTYGNQVSFTTPDLSLGQSLLDGIVFFIDSTGQHGLIVAPNDQGKISWYNGNYIKTDAMSFTNGYTNTGYILSAQGNASSYAAIICSQYIVYFYGFVWFLPSKDQLNLMYNHKNLIVGLSDLPYWSSTESDSNLAWAQDFSNGNQGIYDKSLAYGARAIRSF